LVPLFRGGNYLVKSLSVIIDHRPEIFWEGVSLKVKEMHLEEHSTPHDVVKLNKISYLITIASCLLVSSQN
jgi:hypothetical protein